MTPPPDAVTSPQRAVTWPQSAVTPPETNSPRLANNEPPRRRDAKRQCLEFCPFALSSRRPAPGSPSTQGERRGGRQHSRHSAKRLRRRASSLYRVLGALASWRLFLESAADRPAPIRGGCVALKGSVPASGPHLGERALRPLVTRSEGETLLQVGDRPIEVALAPPHHGAGPPGRDKTRVELDGTRDVGEPTRSVPALG